MTGVQALESTHAAAACAACVLTTPAAPAVVSGVSDTAPPPTPTPHPPCLRACLQIAAELDALECEVLQGALDGPSGNVDEGGMFSIQVGAGAAPALLRLTSPHPIARTLCCKWLLHPCHCRAHAAHAPCRC